MAFKMKRSPYQHDTGHSHCHPDRLPDGSYNPEGATCSYIQSNIDKFKPSDTAKAPTAESLTGGNKAQAVKPSTEEKSENKSLSETLSGMPKPMPSPERDAKPTKVPGSKKKASLGDFGKLMGGGKPSSSGDYTMGSSRTSSSEEIGSFIKPPTKQKAEAKADPKVGKQVAEWGYIPGSINKKNNTIVAEDGSLVDMAKATRGGKTLLQHLKEGTISGPPTKQTSHGPIREFNPPRNPNEGPYIVRSKPTGQTITDPNYDGPDYRHIRLNEKTGLDDGPHPERPKQLRNYDKFVKRNK